MNIVLTKIGIIRYQLMLIYLKKTIFSRKQVFCFSHMQNNINISISLDLIFFNKKRMIHHYSTSSNVLFFIDS